MMRSRERDGRYANEQRCDGCGGSVKLDDHITDDEVCGQTDGPGFYLCDRKRCYQKRSGLTVEARRELYAAQRARNEEAAR